MTRPRALTFLMWFCAIYAIGAALGIVLVIVDLGRFVGGYSMGGMPVTRAQWLTIAAPLVATVSILMGLTAIALKCHRQWAGIPFMCIWPLIIIYGIGCALVGAIPWTLGLRAVLNATFVGAIALWLLFKYKPSRAYFTGRKQC
ncbi:MAG: hypothetical protein ABJB69_10675, partial [Spartobacteria bacterium]